MTSWIWTIWRAPVDGLWLACGQPHAFAKEDDPGVGHWHVNGPPRRPYLALCGFSHDRWTVLDESPSQIKPAPCKLCTEFSKMSRDEYMVARTMKS